MHDSHHNIAIIIFQSFTFFAFEMKQINVYKTICVVPHHIYVYPFMLTDRNNAPIGAGEQKEL